VHIWIFDDSEVNGDDNYDVDNNDNDMVMITMIIIIHLLTLGEYVFQG